MYLDYWGLTKHPFNNVPDPGMYSDVHQSVDSAVKKILFAVDEGETGIAVVVGPSGVGKTMSLRIVLDSINQDKFRIAFITNPDMTFLQLLREINGQLLGKACEEKTKDALLEVFNRILLETSDKGKRVLIFIDEGNVIKPHNLENIRMLTNMQNERQNLFTIVLAGQPELGKRLEDPERENLFQRIGVYCKIEGIDSPDNMREYIDYRLKCAGNRPGRSIFTKTAIKALWSISDNGTPRLINKMCTLSLKAGETNQVEIIDESIISSVGSSFIKSYAKKAKRSSAQMPEIQPLADHPFAEDSESVMSNSKDRHDGIASHQEKPQKKQEPLNEIAPAEEDLTSLENAIKTVQSSSREQKQLSNKELEELASRLATARVKKMDHLKDPFEAWEEARTDILQQLKNSNKVKHNEA